MQATRLKKCLVRISTLTPSPTPFKSTLVSFSINPDSTHVGKLFPNHPILWLLEKAHDRHIDLRTLHAHTITSGLIRDPFAASRIVEFFLQSNSGDPRYAIAVFDSIDRPDIYTWNAMIIGHTAHGSPELAVVCYFRMRASRAPPNNYTFALLVKACIMGGSSGIGLGKEVHGQVMKCGVEDFLVVRNSLLSMYCNMGLLGEAQLLFEKSLHLDLIAWNTMISAYGKIGDVGTARNLFDQMPTRSLVSWSAMINGYVISGYSSEALRIFNEMQGEGIRPDVVTLVSVLKACAHLGALDQGRWVQHYIDKNKLGRDVNVVLGTALVDMYCKCGCIDVALEVFNSVRSMDVVLWNAMIGGLAMHGHGEGALELFRRMKEEEIAPNGVTFIGVLCSCTHAGLVSNGIRIFESMKDHGIEPQREHYGCLADLLGRAGRVQEAEDILLKMPMEPQASQWGALMSSCRMHNNIEVGERVGKRLISMEPYDGGRYVQLANIYAASNRWEDARDIRRAMEGLGIKKETGCSFVEWNGVVHEFIVGDTTHPQSREIYAVLSEMERKLEMVGYVKDTSQLLVDVDDEEEKGMALSYHSERLAIAFGIINVCHGIPIRVVKNLRVCRDCHTHAKLVSKVYQREIIVRDRNRFHRFKEGSCSCKDYW